MQRILCSLALLTSLSALANDDAPLMEAGKVASSVPPKLLRVLSDEIARGGPESAIDAPDVWERAALEEWEIMANADHKEHRYMTALPVQQICLACHGPIDTLKPEVTSRLQAL